MSKNLSAIIACVCGKSHDITAPTGSAPCSCGRVVLLEQDTNAANHVRPWCDENGVDYPGNYSAPEILGWKFPRKESRHE